MPTQTWCDVIHFRPCRQTTVNGSTTPQLTRPNLRLPSTLNLRSRPLMVDQPPTATSWRTPTCLPARQPRSATVASAKTLSPGCGARLNRFHTHTERQSHTGLSAGHHPDTFPTGSHEVRNVTETLVQATFCLPQFFVHNICPAYESSDPSNPDGLHKAGEVSAANAAYTDPTLSSSRNVDR